MTAYHVVVAERKDLAVVTIVCPNPKCGAATSIDVSRQQELMDKSAGKIPESCPSCDESFGHEAVAALRSLAAFHRGAIAAEGNKGPTFRFEIKTDLID
jgi:hypothetical protein